MAPTSRQDLFGTLAALNPSDRVTLVELLEELVGASPRSAAVGLPKLASVLRSLEPKGAVSWLDLGVSMASQSSTAAQRYFSESPDLLDAVSPARRSHLLTLGLELSDGHHGVVMDFLRAGAQLPEELDTDGLLSWMEIGRRLAEEDSVLAVEFFRISPEVLRRISIADLPVWVQVGRDLVEPNVFGKPDYLKVIEYFRLSSEFLSGLEPPDLRRPFLDLGMILAERSPSIGMDYLRAGPAILHGFESPAQRRLILSQGRRLADAATQDPSVVLDYLREASKMYGALGDSPSDFVSWVDAGLGLLTKNPERAKAYFSGRSQTGQDTTERLIGGVSLAAVGRTLTLFAEGLSGRTVAIKSTRELPENLRQMIGDSPSTDGRTIYLPDRIRYFPNDEDNFRLYRVTTLHEAGHLEFGTYDPPLDAMTDLIEAVASEYGKAAEEARAVRTAGDFFRLFPNPTWARSLWSILEDARIDFRIRTEYPGVRRDMDRIVSFDLQSRPALDGLPPRVAIHEALLQLSVTDTTEAPLELAEIVSAAYNLLLEVKNPQATAVDTFRILVRLYRYVEEQLRRFPGVQGETDPLGMKENEPDVSSDPSSGRNRSASSAVPSTLSYRGTMHPEWIRSRTGDETVPIDTTRLDPEPNRPSPLHDPRSRSLGDPRRESAAVKATAEGGSRVGATRTTDRAVSDRRFFLYDEWDERMQEYRPKWCRLFEYRIQPEPSSIVEQTLAQHGPELRLLRRHFQALKPEAFRKIKRQIDGDHLDLDAVIEARTEIRRGQPPSDSVYIRNEKRVRDVAVAFLVDMSGSTSRQIPSIRKRVIEVEQEALVLMAEALEAAGDMFAVYGFSGDSKDRVEFYIIKDFEDPFTGSVHDRIGAMRSLNQNRDGAAIRHAREKLEEQPARTRLLILLSDGKPLDSGYAGEHSLQDTKMALRETRIRGIHPYCITIDREASRYVTEMYGDVEHTIIDRVSSLPERLPRIYRRLTT